MKVAYVNFVNHCYVDTEVEMKEIYTSHHIWKLFENFLVDMARVMSSPRSSSKGCVSILQNRLFFLCFVVSSPSSALI